MIPNKSGSVQNDEMTAVIIRPILQHHIFSASGMIQPARQSLEVLELLPTKQHSGVSTLHYQELLAKEDNSPATRHAEFPLWGLRSDNVWRANWSGLPFLRENPKHKNFCLASVLNWFFTGQDHLAFLEISKNHVDISISLDTLTAPIPCQPYLHSNHRHCGSGIQSPSSTKHLRALFQETSKDTQRLAPEINNWNMLKPDWSILGWNMLASLKTPPCRKLGWRIMMAEGHFKDESWGKSLSQFMHPHQAAYDFPLPLPH